MTYRELLEKIQDGTVKTAKVVQRSMAGCQKPNSPILMYYISLCSFCIQPRIH